MRILSIDSSGLVASVAILDEDTLVAEYTINHKKTHSQTLLPMVDEIFKMTEIDKQSLDAIAIAAGPGSFTGLRIGAATAKGLGQALNIPLISVPTVDGLAYNLVGSNDLICPLMDARRRQVYTGLYTFEKDEFKVLLPQCAIGIDEIINKINEMGTPVVFLGDGVPVNNEYIQNNCKVNYTFAPANASRQRAASVACLAYKYYENEAFSSIRKVEAFDFLPEYLRLSQAEREMLEKEKGKN